MKKALIKQKFWTILKRYLATRYFLMMITNYSLILIQQIHLKVKIFLGCPFNTNLNDLANQKIKPSSDWKTDCQEGVWEDSGHSVSNGCKNWFGWGNSNTVGSLSTTLKGNGRAELDFGNCFSRGKVKAYVDGYLIETANANEVSKKKQFQFDDGSELKIEEDIGIIQFNSLTMIECSEGML